MEQHVTQKNIGAYYNPATACIQFENATYRIAEDVAIKQDVRIGENVIFSGDARLTFHGSVDVRDTPKVSTGMVIIFDDAKITYPKDIHAPPYFRVTCYNLEAWLNVEEGVMEWPGGVYHFEENIIIDADIEMGEDVTLDIDAGVEVKITGNVHAAGGFSFIGGGTLTLAGPPILIKGEG